VPPGVAQVVRDTGMLPNEVPDHSLHLCC